MGFGAVEEDHVALLLESPGIGREHGITPRPVFEISPAHSNRGTQARGVYLTNNWATRTMLDDRCTIYAYSP